METLSLDKEDFLLGIKALARISEVRILDLVPDEFLNAPSKLIGRLKLILQVSVDPESEKIRIGKEIEKYQLEVKKANNKLANKKFLEKAPKKIVTQERERLAQFSEKVEKLKYQVSLFG